VFDDGRFECDSRGNVDGSFNRNVDVTGYVNLIIYNAYEKSGRRGDKYLDAYISCTDEEGRMRDEDEDGKPDVIHRGETVLEIEDVEKQTLAIVE
jgi:hypothetical protein